MADKIIPKEHWRQRNYEKIKNTPAFKAEERRLNLLSKYAISLEDYQKILDKQKGVCAICKLPPEGDTPLFVDHCHKSTKVRGLLHNRCNLALGMLHDDPELIGRMKGYLHE